MLSCWNSSFQSWFLIGYQAPFHHVTYGFFLQPDLPSITGFGTLGLTIPTWWSSSSLLVVLTGWGGLETASESTWNTGVGIWSFWVVFFFFWPSEAMWIFRESINFFNPVPTASLSHLGSMGFTKSRSISCICSFFWWGGGLAFSRISTFLLVLTRDLLMDGY